MSDLVKIDFSLPKVKFSKDELKAIVDEQVEPLRGFVHESDIRKARAAVRAIITDYEEQRKDITRQWDATKKTFTSDVKDALASAHELDEEYSEKLAEIDEQAKAEKLEQITGLSGFNRWYDYYDIPTSWYNKTMSIDKIESHIHTDMEQVMKNTENIVKTAGVLNLPADRFLDMYSKSVPFEEVMDRMRDFASIRKDETETDIEESATLVKLMDAIKHYDIAADADTPRMTLNRNIIATTKQTKLLKLFCDIVGIEIQKENE